MKETIYIFCPKQDKKTIINLIKQYKNIKYFINIFSLNIKFLKKVKIFYYNSLLLNEQHERTLLKIIKYGYKVYPLIDFFDKKKGYSDLSLINNDYFLSKNQFCILNKKRNFLLKRIIDILISLILLIILIPFILLVAFFIFLESKGPIFYSQKRVGFLNKEFKLFKFRSMRKDAEKNGATWTKKSDKRITKIGFIIRRTRIDELPQLWNVLKGEMSLIGPRPERKVFVGIFKKKIPYYDFRHAVKPGISGLAQVKYSYGSSLRDAKKKHCYDLYYIKHHSFFLDIKIFFSTIKTISFGKGQ